MITALTRTVLHRTPTKLTLIGASLLTVAALAQSPIQSQRVQFARGTSSATIKGQIKGDQIIDYLVGARAGQTLSVKLSTSNASNYFNVTAAGSDTAMFVGSSGGESFTGVLPKNGDYTVRVYLMRNAARRNESASYTLTIGVDASKAAAAPAVAPVAKGPSGSGAPITAGNMPAYCRGEVSSMYGTRPTYVKTNAPRKAADGSTSIDGTVDKGTEGIKQFKCRFDAQSRFIDVMAMTSDGE